MNTRFAIVATLVILAAFPARSQTDSLYDLFPLAIGNQWTYRYSSSRSEVCGTGYGSHSDTGTAYFAILNAIQTPDTTRWIFSERLDAVNRFCCTTPDTMWCSSYAHHDSSVFQLIELHAGFRQLLIGGTTVTGIFPFNNIITFRYRTSPTWQYTCPPPAFGPPSACGVQFEQGQGEIGYSGYGGYAYAYASWNYSLLRAVISSVRSTGVFQPNQFVLAQNFPNPFNPITTISFEIERSGFVSLKIFDVLGNEATTLLNGDLTRGSYEAVFDAGGLASGVYFYQLRASNVVATKKLVLTR